MKTFKMIFLAAMLSLFSVAVHAKGFLIINTGEEVFPLKNRVMPLEELDTNWNLGYKCSHFGIMWADVWTWNCQMVALNMSEESYMDLPFHIKYKASHEYSMSDTVRGTWNHYGFLGMLLAFAAYIFMQRRA